MKAPSTQFALWHGIARDTPSHMSIEATSTDQQHISEFLNEVRALVRENQLVLINETRA